jgi:beta-phosphoglucomutase-like phosphatase (HAD superfamily)
MTFTRTLFARKKEKRMIKNEGSVADKIDSVLKKYETSAVIFDLDGTLLDNNSFHRKTWEAYLKNIGKLISEEEFNTNLNGRTNKDAIEYIYGRKMDEVESTKYTLEKEALYRQIYKPFIKPVPGLLNFLEILNQKRRVFSPILILCLKIFLSNIILK